MATILNDIEAVRSLRKALRNPTLPIEMLSSIELIHSCIKSGTDTNGWKRNDWRGGVSHSHSKGAYTHSKSSFVCGGGGGGGGRHSSGNDKPHHSTFSSRPRGAAVKPATDTPTSIPLVSPTTVAAGGAGAGAEAVPEVIHTRYPSQKYVSKFKKTSDKVEDTILNTILLGKLNKFSEQNYDEIKEFITHIIDNGETDMIKCFMKLVFEKAASEEIFCPLYAKLLSELSTRYPVLLTEMANLYVQYMAIFEEVKEDEASDYNEFCKRNVEQKYRRGYSQFLAELIKHDVIDSDTFMKTVIKIITQVNNNIKLKESLKVIEEYADCLMRIVRAIKPTSDINYSSSIDIDADNKIAMTRVAIKEQACNLIRPFTLKNTEFTGLSNKARFTFLNIYEDIRKF
jgi:hypothetical protein